LSGIFLKEARADLLQGITIPRDEPSEDRRIDGYAGFQRYACKMATGSGKTTAIYSALYHIVQRAGPAVSISTVIMTIPVI